MAENSKPAGQLSENGAVQEFLKLLTENRPDKGQDFSVMLWQLEGMGRQLDAALHELQEVKTQLAEMQKSPAVRFTARAVSAAGGRLQAVQERLAEIRDRIVEGAKEAVAGFKRVGVKALDKAVSALCIKKALERTQKDLTESISDVKESIGKIETIGIELRSVGGHIRNAGRVIAGKEQQKVDGGMEGRFQAAVLSPLRIEKNILTKLNNITLAAIGSVERLEQAAGRTKEEAIPKDGQKKGPKIWEDVDDADSAEPPKKKQPEKEKPSVLKEIQEGKAQAAARTVPAPDKERKMQAVSL